MSNFVFKMQAKIILSLLHIMPGKSPTKRRRIKKLKKKWSHFGLKKQLKIFVSTFFFFLGSLTQKTPSDKILANTAWYAPIRHISKKKLPRFCVKNTPKTGSKKILEANCGVGGVQKFLPSRPKIPNNTHLNKSKKILKKIHQKKSYDRKQKTPTQKKKNVFFWEGGFGAQRVVSWDIF